jgi:hypothetical protein
VGKAAAFSGYYTEPLAATGPLLGRCLAPNPSWPRLWRSTVRIVSRLTPKSAASARRLLVPARMRIFASCFGVSRRARERYRGREEASHRDGHRGSGASSERRSGNGMRHRPSGPIEDAETDPRRFRHRVHGVDLARCKTGWCTRADGRKPLSDSLVGSGAAPRSRRKFASIWSRIQRSKAVSWLARICLDVIWSLSLATTRRSPAGSWCSQ